MSTTPASTSSASEGGEELGEDHGPQGHGTSKERADTVRTALLKKHPEIDAASGSKSSAAAGKEPAGPDGNLNRRVEVQWFTLE